jgi:hypothetical protein
VTVVAVVGGRGGRGVALPRLQLRGGRTMGACKNGSQIVASLSFVIISLLIPY